MDQQMLYEATVQPQEQEQHEGLGMLRDQILAILPIPSAILSVLGSSVILYMAFSTRRKRKWTTYTRLLIGLSMCDIISSVSFGLAAFMRRPESERAWAMGNDATCTTSGALIQFSFSNFLYNAMLSFYFLATVRFGVKHTVIAKRFEPIMHLVSLGFPLVTSIVGAIMGMYRETATGFGCWVNNYPVGCGNDPGQERCLSGIIGSVYFGLPLMFSIASITINNLIIWCYVRKQRKPLLKTQRKKTASYDSSSSVQFDTRISLDASIADVTLFTKKVTSIGTEEEGVSDGVANGNTKDDQSSIDQSNRCNSVYKDQMRRLQLVSSQAFLFVISYILCNAWIGLMAIAEAKTKEEDEAKMMSDIYGLMVVNAIFAPLQGFLNMLVYMRPKYVKATQQFPRESRSWVFRRAVLGDSVRPEQKEPPRKDQDEEQGDGTVSNKSGLVRIPEGLVAAGDIQSNKNDRTQHMVPLPKRTMVSSLTASLGDFVEYEEDIKDKSQTQTERTKGAFEGSSTLPRFQFQSSLEYMGRSLQAISELTESVFESIVQLPEDEDDSGIRCMEDDSFQLETCERRWQSSTTHASSLSTPSNSDNSKGEGSQLEKYRNDDAALQSNNIRLVAPRRMDSEYDIMDFDEEEEKEQSDAMDDSLEEFEEDINEEFIFDLDAGLSKLDAPAAIPLRRRSLSLSLESKSSVHSCGSSISSSCSVISFSAEEDPEFGEDDVDRDYPYRYEERTADGTIVSKNDQSEISEASSSDTPIKAPRRKLSPVR